MTSKKSLESVKVLFLTMGNRLNVENYHVEVIQKIMNNPQSKMKDLLVRIVTSKKSANQDSHARVMIWKKPSYALLARCIRCILKRFLF